MTTWGMGSSPCPSLTAPTRRKCCSRCQQDTKARATRQDNMTKIEKAAIMARVSTGRQLDNTSPDEQIRRGREYAAERGYKIVAERTEAISGAFVLARSAVIEVLEMAEKGKLDVVVFD